MPSKRWPGVGNSQSLQGTENIYAEGWAQWGWRVSTERHPGLEVLKPNQVDKASPWESNLACSLRVWTGAKTRTLGKSSLPQDRQENQAVWQGEGGALIWGVRNQAGYGQHPAAWHGMFKPEENEASVHRERGQGRSKLTCSEEGLSVEKEWQWEIAYIQRNWANKKINTE